MATAKTTDTNELLLQLLAQMNQNSEAMNQQQLEALKATRKVKILNILPYDIGFATKSNPFGFVIAGGKVDTQLTIAELEELVHDENPALVGVDGKGSHATLKILDFEIYKKVFDLPDATEEPFYLTEEEMERLLKIKNPDEFKAELDR